MNEIIAKLQENGFNDFKQVAGNKISVLSNGHRPTVMGQIANILGGTVNPDPRKGSSLGCVEIPNTTFVVLVKPANRQGRNSAGIGNETFLYGKIQEYLAGGVKNICFKTTNKDIMCRDVTSCEMVGRDTANRKKTDIKFTTAQGECLNISIKKDNAEIWESADTYAREITKNVLDRVLAESLVEMQEIHGNLKKITKNLAWKATGSQAKDVIFGSDLMGTGGVVVKTFTNADFTVKGDTLYINSTEIFSSLEDIGENHQVYFLVRNDRSRLSGVAGFPGIRVLAVAKSRITPNVALV